MNERKSLNYESRYENYDSSLVATKFLSKVLKNAIKQRMFCEQKSEHEYSKSISGKKAIHILNNTSLMIPIEASLSLSHMLCCLKNFEEQGLTYVMYEEPEDTSIKTILVSEEDYEEALAVVLKHEENQGIDEIFAAYGAEASEAVSKFYQDKYDALNVKENDIEDVINDVRDRAGLDGNVCYIINRTNPENVAEVISIKKYKDNNDFIIISEINVYKEEKKVKAYSEVEMEYGHLWQDIKERIVDLMDAESGVVVFNTLQEVIKYKELFYEQLELRNDLIYELITRNMSELGTSDCLEKIIEDLENELTTKKCLFVEEKDNIKEQIENYKYINVLMKDYEDEVVEYMARNNSSEYDNDIFWEKDTKDRLEEKANELEQYLQKSKILQIERFCIVRNCIGKNTAELVVDTIDRNISIIAEKFVDAPYMSDDEEEDLWDGLNMKLSRVRREYDGEEKDVDESVS